MLKKLVKKELNPNSALKYLANEVVHTSKLNNSVGDKILALCIPKNSILAKEKTENSMLLAKTPDLETSSFTFFDPEYDELKQYGPSFACDETGFSNIETENDPSRNYQSSIVKILAMPNK